MKKSTIKLDICKGENSGRFADQQTIALRFFQWVYCFGPGNTREYKGWNALSLVCVRRLEVGKGGIYETRLKSYRIGYIASEATRFLNIANGVRPRRSSYFSFISVGDRAGNIYCTCCRKFSLYLWGCAPLERKTVLFIANITSEKGKFLQLLVRAIYVFFSFSGKLVQYVKEKQTIDWSKSSVIYRKLWKIFLQFKKKSINISILI